MALFSGSQGEDVAALQRYLTAIWKKWGYTPKFQINGTMDTATQQAVAVWQRRVGRPATGRWEAGDLKRANDKSPGSIPYRQGSGNTLSTDRSFALKSFETFFGRQPTVTELDSLVSTLQAGQPQKTFLRNLERRDAEGSTKRLYMEILGREPTADELAGWMHGLRNATTTRLRMREYLSNTHEARTRVKEVAAAPGQEDALARLNRVLDEFGLSELKDWAWDQIKSGHTDAQILQDLREQDVYKTRFAGMEARRAAGLKPINEQQYIAYEAEVRTLLRRNGLPPSFYDEPSDFTALLAADVSLDEVSARINEGYKRVTEAPMEVRQAFAELYGTDGDAALAALFVDPDRGELALLKQARTAETKGWGGLFGIDFSAPEAERVAEVNLNPDQLRQGLGQIQQAGPLFDETVSEDTDLTAGQAGAEAAFGLGGTGAADLEKRRATRVAATKGGGGANISQSGVGVGAAN